VGGPRPADQPARRLRGDSRTAEFATLNARVASLYQLSAAEFEHVLNTFPLFPSEERRRAFEELKRITIRG
jgi:hypothetical protein